MTIMRNLRENLSRKRLLLRLWNSYEINKKMIIRNFFGGLRKIFIFERFCKLMASKISIIEVSE